MGCSTSTPSVVEQAQKAVEQAGRGSAYAVKQEEAAPSVPPAAAAEQPPAAIKSAEPSPHQQQQQQPPTAAEPVSTSEPQQQGHKSLPPHPALNGGGPNKHKPAAAPPVFSKLRTDCKVRDVYKLGKVIGTGGFSIVRAATDKLTGTEYACKIMSLPTPATKALTGVIGDRDEASSETIRSVSIPCENSREDIFKEIDILCDLNHENVLFLKEYFEEDNKVYLITEILTGGELLDAVLQRGSYNESEARSCFVQLLRGIEYLHSKGVVHRDLKLENLLLKTKEDITAVKIADFGLAKMSAGEAMQTICGTPQYVAPEVIQGLKITQYGPGVDIWGAGIVLFILLGGYPPFYSESEPQLFEQIRKGKFSFEDPVWDGVTESAKDLIRKLLNVDPHKRLTATQALQHEWLAPSQLDPSGPCLAGTQVNLKKHFSNRGPQLLAAA